MTRALPKETTAKKDETGDTATERRAALSTPPAAKHHTRPLRAPRALTISNASRLAGIDELHNRLSSSAVLMADLEAAEQHAGRLSPSCRWRLLCAPTAGPATPARWLFGPASMQRDV